MNSYRRWLASALLSFVAGYVDTIGFVALFGLFTAHVTGNFVLVGATLGTMASGGVSAGLTGKLLALPVFIIGVTLTTVALRSIKRSTGSVAQTALLMQTLGILFFMMAGLWAQPILDADAPSTVICGMLGVLAMSVQNAGARLVFSEMAPSTVMTGNVSQLVIDGLDIWRGVDSASVGSARARVSKMLPSVMTFLVGALAGGLGYQFLGFWALLAAVAALLLAMVVYSFPLQR